MDINKFELKEGKPYYNGIQLSISKNSQGYFRVMINGKAKRLHRLVGLKYIPNPDNKLIVDHIKGDKTLNGVNDLQWLTYSENSRKAYKNNPTMANMNKGNGKPFIATSIITGKEQTFKNLRQCAKALERDVAAVHRCLNGQWTYCNSHRLTYV